MKRLLALFALATLWAAPALAVTFDHAAHLTYIEGSPCSTCHLEGARSIVPDRKVCLECHDEDFTKSVDLPGLKTHGPVWALNHRPFAKGDTPNCASCHQQVDCLECHKSGFADEFGKFGNNMINVHRSDFHVTHPIAARTDQQLCASCHESRFCSDCHKDFRAGRASGPSHQRTFDLGLNGNIDQIHAAFGPTTNCDQCHLQGSVAPDLHTWSVGHGREARRNLATCQACHPSGDTCVKCHSAKGGAGRFNPHGDNWDDRKGRLKNASNGKTCKKCHDQF